MDSLNNISSSKAYTSLGLLDEHLLEGRTELNIFKSIKNKIII